MYRLNEKKFKPTLLGTIRLGYVSSSGSFQGPKCTNEQEYVQTVGQYAKAHGTNRKDRREKYLVLKQILLFRFFSYLIKQLHDFCIDPVNKHI